MPGGLIPTALPNDTDHLAKINHIIIIFTVRNSNLHALFVIKPQYRKTLGDWVTKYTTHDTTRDSNLYIS